MKLDWDLVREILTEIEDLPASGRHGKSFQAEYGDDSETATRARHAILLKEAGFVKGVTSDSLAAARLLAPDLTWEGHELLSTIRSKDVWERVKRTAKEKGLALSFDLVKIGGKMALEQILKGGTATDGSLSV